MQCIANGCESEARYKAERLCQKHYHRKWRTGSTELEERSWKRRYISPSGYVILKVSSHPLANKSGLVSEHRFVMWPIVGEDCRPCEICGKDLSWKTCHIDHIDNDRRNNAAENLRVLCPGCNTSRGFTPESYAERGEIGLIEFEGRRDTPQAWARDPRVLVCGRTIIMRKKMGMSDFDALFSRKVTHNGNPKKDNRPRKTQHKHERSNSIAITIDGITLTASEWSRVEGTPVTENTIINRVRAGWNDVDAVFTPPRQKPDEKYRAMARELKKRLE